LVRKDIKQAIKICFPQKNMDGLIQDSKFN